MLANRYTVPSELGTSDAFLSVEATEFIALLGGAAAAWPLAVRAQQSGKVHFILWVSTEAQPDPFIEGFGQGMKERGYTEGQNLAFVLRYAPGDPAAVQAMLPELFAIPVDLIVSSGPAIQAMKAAAGKPVLFAISGDPVELGIAQSLNHPRRALHRKHVPVARRGAKASAVAS